MKKNLEKIKKTWQVPSYEIKFWRSKQRNYCVVIPVINEGERIRDLIRRMYAINISAIADIIIVDGGSSDGSLAIDWLKSYQVSGLLLKTGAGKLSAQLRCAYAFALEQGYGGIITIDGNNKDDPSSIPDFIQALKTGVDFVQASRFISGGVEENTPKLRSFAIRFIHSPILSFSSGFKWTDTTQGFRAYRSEILLNPKVSPFRNKFLTYELLAYLSYRIPKLRYKCLELPSVRHYPLNENPTKISSVRGNWLILKILFLTSIGFYNP